MKIKQIDEYIKSTQSLLKANPSTTTISITYTHSQKKKTDDDTVIKSIIKFKTYDPKHGISFNFKTHKIKEFSKLANALGPRGCNVEGVDVEGISLILSNTEKSEVVPQTPVVEEAQTDANTSTTQEPTTQKKKSKKKKGKK